MKPKLREAQELFFALLAAPEGVAKGIAGLEAAGRPAGAEVDAWIAGDERLGARGRLDVYANMYFFRIRDAVAEDFPALAAFLGEARWHNLMTDYLLAHPSRHWSLRWAGARLPEFLESHELAEDRPELADLARLEFALADAFQAEDAPALTGAALAGIPPGEWPGLRFAIAPHVHLVEVSYEVERLHDAPRDAPPAARRPHAILVFREEDAARYEEAPEPEALRALLSGEPFGAVCERLAVGGGEAEAAKRAAGLLAGALERGLLRGFAEVP